MTTTVTQSELAAWSETAHRVDTYLADFLKHRPMPHELRDAVEYSLFGGGKRLRPLLVLNACAAAGGKPQDALPAAAAAELIHCFSLVHDDLPAMDDDDLRRGRPTLHKHTNEALAILAGDLMQGLAFELLATNVSDPDVCAAMVRELAIATSDMIGGQVYDTFPDSTTDGGSSDDDEDAPDELERLERTHRYKTGALIRAAVRMGGLSAGASGSELSALTRYAEAVGLMFQIVDDVLDVTSDAQTLGKATQKDEAAGKLTYPGLLGLQASRDEAERLRGVAHDALEELESPQGLALLADWLATRQK